MTEGTDEGGKPSRGPRGNTCQGYRPALECPSYVQKLIVGKAQPFLGLAGLGALCFRVELSGTVIPELRLLLLIYNFCL